MFRKSKQSVLDWQTLQVEQTGNKEFGPCSCCGNMSRTIWGFVHSHNSTLAAYFVQWTLNNPQHGANFDLIVGAWGKGTDAQDRKAVSLEYRVIEHRGEFMVIDASARPVADPSMAKETLRRDQIIGRPLAQEIFAIVDAIIVKDERIREIQSWSN